MNPLERAKQLAWEMFEAQFTGETQEQCDAEFEKIWEKEVLAEPTSTIDEFLEKWKWEIPADPALKGRMKADLEALLENSHGWCDRNIEP